MDEFEWVITELEPDTEGNLTVCASGTAPTFEEAKREMEHYAMQYSQDGSIRVQMFEVTREEIKNYCVIA